MTDDERLLTAHVALVAIRRAADPEKDGEPGCPIDLARRLERVHILAKQALEVTGRDESG